MQTSHLKLENIQQQEKDVNLKKIKLRKLRKKFLISKSKPFFTKLHLVGNSLKNLNESAPRSKNNKNNK